jgi:hypothetical protein
VAGKQLEDGRTLSDHNIRFDVANEKHHWDLLVCCSVAVVCTCVCVCVAFGVFALSRALVMLAMVKGKSKRGPVRVGLGKRPAACVKQQPMAVVARAPSLLAEATTFVRTFGSCPPKQSTLARGIRDATGPLGEQLANLFSGLPTLHKSSFKQASALIAAAKSSKSLTKFKVWASTTRRRVELGDSELVRLLQVVAPAGAGRPSKRLMNSTSLRGAATQYSQKVDYKGAIPVVVGATGSADGDPLPTADGETNIIIPYTPQFVVDWLYQALLDTVRVLESVLGVVAYDKLGDPHGAGKGQVVLWWGTHLGSVRDQALIAWDYDIDLAVFYHGDHGFDDTWNIASNALRKLGYRTTKHGNKFRLGPQNPAAWAPWQELYQSVYEKQPMARPQLVKEVARRWQQGEQSKHPHGQNCIDIEVYKMQRAKPFTILGTTPFQLAAKDVFPTKIGVFGPLVFNVPQSTLVLEKEYGKKCISQRMAKVKNAKGGVLRWTEVPSDKRRSAWPACQLQHCIRYLS